MPAARRYLLSVAPVPIVGMTRTFGPNTARVTFSIGCMISGESGDGDACSIAGAFEIFTPVSLAALSSDARTSSGSWPGAIRQFTFAVAVCGSALRAWPPLSIVATHVVRSMERYRGSAEIVALAFASFGLATIARIAAAIAGASIFAVPVKNARVTSLSITGNW